MGCALRGVARPRLLRLARHILLDAYTQAVSVDSDSDSIGSVMGSLVALCFQLGNLVEPQIKRVRGLDEVQAVAERFLTQLGYRLYFTQTIGAKQLATGPFKKDL